MYCYPPEVYLRSGLRIRPSPDDLGVAMLDAIAAGELVEVDPPLDHYHVPGLYGRRITVPAGVCVVTKLHRSRHLTIALSGHCTVVDQDGTLQEIHAPGVWITEPGTQRSVLCHTETQWITVHAVPEGLTDVAALEELLVVDTLKEARARWRPALNELED